MIFVEKPINLNDLWANRTTNFSELIKIAVDIENEWIVLDGEMHADCESALLEKGSKQENIWGANVYPENSGDNFLEFISFINIRPSQDNPSMEIQNPEIRGKIKQIIHRLLITS
ncbi:MAG: DUF5674 family protein [Candidatus Neomarinimicrobiota bacterium]